MDDRWSIRGAVSARTGPFRHGGHCRSGGLRREKSQVHREMGRGGTFSPCKLAGEGMPATFETSSRHSMKVAALERQRVVVRQRTAGKFRCEQVAAFAQPR